MNLAIIQARISSSRFPAKSLHKFNDQNTLVELVHKRISMSCEIHKIIFAVPNTDDETPLYDFLTDRGFEVFRGPKHDVLSRFYEANMQFGAKYVVRVTADDPFKDFEAADSILRTMKANNYDYGFNNGVNSGPLGSDIEVISQNLLNKTHHNASKNQREHVTTWIRENINFIKHFEFSYEANFSEILWTIDLEEDFERLRKLMQFVWKHPGSKISELIKLGVEYDCNQ